MRTPAQLQVVVVVAKAERGANLTLQLSLFTSHNTIACIENVSLPPLDPNDAMMSVKNVRKRGVEAEK